MKVIKTHTGSYITVERGMEFSIREISEEEFSIGTQKTTLAIVDTREEAEEFLELLATFLSNPVWDLMTPYMYVTCAYDEKEN